ncbi:MULTISPECIES: histidine kinase [unclassified Clostridioides]|uniref:histidine kinase n=1 Tax=unclassified Clostridioides TaxID=2635829 RepID=UPI001D112B24|nr:histidine kinase [Clostridioides sp. ES-S-0145-01]MCC0702399.1 histidine kinase [Clostridioides sp. ES-S-0049-02]MCC0706903.1 histidine kinase [Clostridioides sp. ES-S-0190-01]
MLDTFITIVSSIIEIWACKKVFDYTSKVKTNLMKLNISFLFSIFLIICSFYINVGANDRIWICILITFIFYKSNYKVNIYKCLVVLFFYWMVLIGINALSMLLVVSMNNLDNMNILLSGNLYRYEAIFFGKLILIILLYIYKISCTNFKISKKELYICVPMIANLLSFFILYDYIINLIKISPERRVVFLVIVLLLILSNISIFALIRIILKIKDKKDNIIN